MILSNTSIRQHGRSEQLVVLLHAWTMSSADLVDVIEAVEQAMPDADLLVPDYPSGLFSNVDPVRIVQALVAEIDDAVATRKEQKLGSSSAYDEIVLIGHSVGALLARKVFVFSKGQTQDEASTLKSKPKEWSGRVSRIILMAGMNRGWTFKKKARDLSRLHWWIYRTGAFLHRWTRLGGLINSVRRGTPFIVNLRIQWLNLIRQNDELPVTIQLLGDRDDVVTEEDNVDLQSGARFIYKRVRDTGHGDVIQFSADAEHRKATFSVCTPDACGRDGERCLSASQA